MGIITVSEELNDAWKEAGIIPYTLYESVSEDFLPAIQQVKNEHKYGTFVTPHTLEEYSQMELFLTVDHSAGIAIEHDGNIVSVFSAPKNIDTMKTLLPVAIEHGGKKLDNYNSSKLSAMYKLYGFIPVAKVKFNPEFAPFDWNYQRDGMPDIYFWIHNGKTAEQVVRDLKYFSRVPYSILEFETYEEAFAYRDSLIEQGSSLPV